MAAGRPLAHSRETAHFLRYALAATCGLCQAAANAPYIWMLLITIASLGLAVEVGFGPS